MAMSKILIDDDGVSNTDAITMVLVSHDFEVESIHKSDLLQPTIKSFQPDLILMDIILDTNDGREVWNQLKKNHLTKAIPVMLITAMLESQVEQIPCNADAIMFKPFDYTKLGDNLKELLSI